MSRRDSARQGGALDHVGVVGHDLATLAAQYARLGFTLTPRALTGGGRIANRCAMLRQGYLELMALAPAGPARHWRKCWRVMPAPISSRWPSMTSGDHRAAASRRDRLSGGGTVRARNRRADPSAPRARFAHLPVPEQPEARINLIRHLTPELLWHERFLSHPNHAVALAEVVLAVPAPAESAARLSRLAGCPVVPDPAGGYALVLPRGRIRLLPPDALEVMPPSEPSIAGITLRTDDTCATITRLLSAAGVPHGVADGAVTTLPASSGVWRYVSPKVRFSVTGIGTLAVHLSRSSRERSRREAPGEGRAACTTLTRVARAPRVGPLRGPTPRRAGEVWRCSTRPLCRRWATPRRDRQHIHHRPILVRAHPELAADDTETAASLFRR